jgi:hypothetical protein
MSGEVQVLLRWYPLGLYEIAQSASHRIGRNRFIFFYFG